MNLNAVTSPPEAVPRRRPANPDLAAQLRAVRRVISDIAEQRRVQSDESDGSATSSKIVAKPVVPPAGHRQFFTDADFAIRKEWGDSLAGDSKTVVKEHLRRAQAIGSIRRVAVAPEPHVLDPISIDFPNFSEVTELIKRRLTLSRCAPERVFRLPPLLLAGPPGLGKTAYTTRLAQALGLPYQQIDMSSVHAAFTLTGLDIGYASGGPGLVWDALQHECISAIMLLDELDKASGESKDGRLTFLYSLLEGHSARRYKDAALGLSVDASYLNWIATCNELDRIPAPLRSRFEILHIERPTPAQRVAIVHSIHTELRRNAEWSAWFDADLDPAVVDKMNEWTPREIRRGLEEAYAVAAANQRRRLTTDDLLRRPGGDEEGSTKSPIGFIG
ncbi:MAG: AAA family ATPase [Burkholderiaceae bacterium]